MTGAERLLSFNADIRPLLADRCFACHGFDSNAREADLRLDIPEGALEKREDADPVIIPGNPKASLAWQRIIATDPDEVMPPPDFIRQLSKEDKDLIRRWIEQGAQYEPHWTFVPVVKPDLENDDHPVDQLVTKRLKISRPSLPPHRRPRGGRQTHPRLKAKLTNDNARSHLQWRGRRCFDKRRWNIAPARKRC